MHDELVLEAEPRMVAEAAKLVQISMEGAASLLGMMQFKRFQPNKRLLY